MKTTFCLVLMLMGCSQAPTKEEKSGSQSVAEAEVGNPADGSSASGKSGAAAGTTNLSLQKMEPDAPSVKSFDFTVESEMIWASTEEVIFAHSDGRSITYSRKTGTWSSTLRNENTEAYDQIYDFRSMGLFGLKPDNITFRSGTNPVVHAPRPTDLGTARLAIGPGFASAIVGSAAVVINGLSTEAKRLDIADLPENLQMIYPCNAGCTLWAYDGSRLWAYDAATKTWQRLPQVVAAADEKLLRIALHFSDDKLNIDSVAARGESGTVYLGTVGTLTKEALTWAKDIKPLADHFCVSCHLDDGFENEEVWKTLKPGIIARLKLPITDKAAMPPPETTIGKEIADSDKRLILAWVSGEEQIESQSQGSVGAQETAPIDKAISGNLKTTAEANCIACHFDAKNEAFWKDKKTDIIDRITSGNMPLRNALTAAQKQEMLDAVNALK